MSACFHVLRLERRQLAYIRGGAPSFTLYRGLVKAGAARPLVEPCLGGGYEEVGTQWAE